MLAPKIKVKTLPLMLKTLPLAPSESSENTLQMQTRFSYRFGVLLDAFWPPSGRFFAILGPFWPPCGRLVGRHWKLLGQKSGKPSSQPRTRREPAENPPRTSREPAENQPKTSSTNPEQNRLFNYDFLEGISSSDKRFNEIA